jgi:hypothetical protein
MDSISERILKTANGIGNPGVILQNTRRRDREILTKTTIRVYAKNLSTCANMAITRAALPAMPTNFVGLTGNTVANNKTRCVWPKL